MSWQRRRHPAARLQEHIDDLYELRRNGVAAAITRAHREGATVMGICGGYQMMGQEVLDPEHVEGDIERLPGLGLLPISTRMSGEKVTRQVKFGLCNPHSPSSTLRSPFMQGYEIHMGVTTPVEGAPDSPLNLLENALPTVTTWTPPAWGPIFMAFSTIRNS